MAVCDTGLKAVVLGAAGYVGGELLRLLAGHPAVGELRAGSGSAAGRAWSEVHPPFLHAAVEGRFEALAPGEAAAWADVVLLALPHGRSRDLMDELEAATPRLLIDTSADFRLRNPQLAAQTYGPHRPAKRPTRFATGLADVEGRALAGAARIAVPGCFATAALLSLWPLAGLLDEESRPQVFAITGSSGSGAQPKPATHHPRRAGNFAAYGLAGHRHEAELEERLADWGSVARRCDLFPHSAPLVRGIHATLTARLATPLADPLARLREAYMGRPFIRVLPAPPALSAVTGTNYAHLHAATRDGGRLVVVTTVIDNLVKGAAGQAVQAMNLSLGLPECAGLDAAGLSPC